LVPDTTQSASASSGKSNGTTITVAVIVVVVLVLCIVAGVFFYLRSQKEEVFMVESPQSASDENEEVGLLHGDE